MCAVQFRALSELVQTAFAGLLVLLRVHPKIVLRKASSRVGVVERAVTTVKDVDLRVVQSRVAMRVLFAILRTHKLGPGCTLVILRTRTRER